MQSINYLKYLNIAKNGLINIFYGISNVSQNVYQSVIKKKEKKITDKDMTVTIQKLKEIQKNITDRANNIEKNIKIFFTKAKENYEMNNRKSAIFNLRLKKMYENEKMKLEKINFNIETQIFTLDSFGIIYNTADILKDSAIKINLINRNVDFEKIENTIEELNELTDNGNEINDIMSSGNTNYYDDEELLKELQVTKKEDNDEKDNVNETEYRPPISNPSYNKEEERKHNMPNFPDPPTEIPVSL